MKIVMKIIGIILVLLNGIYILWGLLMLGMASSYGTIVSPIILIIYVIPLIIGIVLIKKSQK